MHASHPAQTLRTRSLLGVPIWSEGLPCLLEQSLGAIARREVLLRPYIFACANPHSLAVADRDADFRSALVAADAVVADGVGVQIAARLCGRAIGARITGMDYFRALMAALDARGGRVVFFGSCAPVLEHLVARASAAFPRVVIVRAISPPYGEWSAAANRGFIDAINEARADVLWVGMTAPRQEKWVYDHQRELRCGVVGSIGAVFDYFAGTVRRAPQWLCDLGFEWAWRLAREPRRLWNRTLVSAPQFLGLAMREALLGPRAARARRVP